MRRKKPTQQQKKFIQGYMCCLATIINHVGENTEHKEAFYACVSNIAECERHEVDSIDLDVLRKYYP